MHRSSPWSRNLVAALFLLLALLQSESLSAQWQQTRGVYSGYIFAFTTLGDLVYCSTAGGVFVSADSGASWAPRSDGLPTASIYALASRGTTLFAGTSQHGVYRSLDSGRSWSEASNGLRPLYTVSALAATKNRVYIPTQSRYLWSTSNDGDRWSTEDTSLTIFSQPRAVLAIGDTTYAVGRWVTRTTDDGRFWTVQSVPPADSSWSMSSLAAIGNLLFAGDDQRGVLRSSNGGVTWEFTAQLPVSRYVQVSLATIGDTLYAAGGKAVYRSTNFGASWQLSTPPQLLNAAVVAIEAWRGILLVATDGGGIVRSTDGGATWTQSDGGAIIARVNQVALYRDSLYIASSAGLYISSDCGRSAHLVPMDSGFRSVNCLLADGPMLLVGTNGSNPLVYTTDAGVKWSRPNGGFRLSSTTVLLKIGNRFFAGGASDDNHGFLFAINSPEGWMSSRFLENVNSPYPRDGIRVGNYLIVGCNDRLYRSTDAFNWLDVGLALSEHTVNWALCSDSTNIYTSITDSSVSDGGFADLGLHASSNFGKEWRPLQDSIRSIAGIVKALAFSNGYLFAGSDSSGVSYSSDGGRTWNAFSQGLRDSSIVSLSVINGVLYAGTANSGLWYRPIAEIPPRSVASQTSFVSEMEIYPNPADTKTTLRFSVREATHARVTIVNLLGVTVMTLLDRDVPAGTETVRLETDNLPPGTYQILLQTSQGGLAHTMTVQR